MIDLHTWLQTARRQFPDISLIGDDPRMNAIQFCEDLAYEAEKAHQPPENREFLCRCYNFIRWSIRNTDAELRGWISHYFWDRILTSGHSKSGCLEFLDWGDVTLLSDGFTTQPMFDDGDNFEALCVQWRKRWSRNQKLPPPTVEAGEDAG